MKDAKKVRIGLIKAENAIGILLGEDDFIVADNAEIELVIKRAHNWLNYAMDGVKDVPNCS